MVFDTKMIEHVFFKPTEKDLFENSILGIQDKIIWLEETFLDDFETYLKV